MPQPVPRRGEIYKIEILEREKTGSEMFGYHAYVIVSTDSIHDLFRVVLGVPLTSPEYKEDGTPKDGLRYRHCRMRIYERQKRLAPGEHGLKGDSLALTYQVRPLAIERFWNVSSSGSVDDDAMAAIEFGLANILKIPPPGAKPAVKPIAHAASVPEVPKPIPGKPQE